VPRVTDAFVAEDAPSGQCPQWAMHLGPVGHALGPDAVGRLTARLCRWYLLRWGPPSEPFAGGLFGLVDGPAQTRGGWGALQCRVARAGAAALGAGAVTAGTATARRR
jgi:hypothetical protein